MFDSQITLKAETLRNSWGINNISPVNILSCVLENIEDLTVLWFPMIDEVSGCCAKTCDDKVICINSKHSRGRQNFTIAHELYHLLYDDDKNSFICNFNSDDESERDADRFAEFLLIPNIALHEFMNRHNIRKWKLEDVIKAEQYFQISHIAMLCKLRRCKLITFDEFKSFRKNVQRCAWDLGYDLDLYNPAKSHYSLGKIIPLAMALHGENRITGGKLDEILLDVFRQDMVYNTLEGDDNIV